MRFNSGIKERYFVRENCAVASHSYHLWNFVLRLQSQTFFNITISLHLQYFVFANISCQKELSGYQKKV